MLHGNEHAYAELLVAVIRQAAYDAIHRKDAAAARWLTLQDIPRHRWHAVAKIRTQPGRREAAC